MTPTEEDLLHEQRKAERELFTALLERVTMRNPPFPISLRAKWLTGMGPHLVVTSRVPERNTGLQAQVEHVFPVPGYLPMIAMLDEREVQRAYFRWIHESLINVFRHELNEAFHIDNHRVHDPHAGEGR